ncbi:probable OmpA/MotB [Psychrobacter arcticus 273-4]|uniref:Probable OmpA/MotB n=1 Tax=Psychrobacter arcticus (strain DSM 17307 / VKM B-2377 / 273-4) TaxID=259536 RepID=Q4FTD3_PSYA2|nr:OmpA family protein [Psychrobacter arcticus]AAZ18725.1 probable OmpA/MotB [Psychrobacter arcticus 273-4]
MQKKPSEWISIADLMSGVMAVVMLLLVISVLQNTYAEIKHKQVMENSQQSDRQKIATLLEDIQTSVATQGAGNLIDFNMEQSKITLKDNVFARGSACITPEAKTAFNNIEDKITSFLQQSSNAKIFVEGHTDNIPVSQPVTDYRRFCTVYDDNYTLSAARAREARKLLVGQLDTSIAKRIVVAGYGDSQPIKGISPEDDANRRVEVRLALE